MAGLKLTKPKETIVVREVQVPAGGPFEMNEKKREELAITGAEKS